MPRRFGSNASITPTELSRLLHRVLPASLEISLAFGQSCRASDPMKILNLAYRSSDWAMKSTMPRLDILRSQTKMLLPGHCVYPQRHLESNTEPFSIILFAKYPARPLFSLSHRCEIPASSVTWCRLPRCARYHVPPSAFNLL